MVDDKLDGNWNASPSPPEEKRRPVLRRSIFLWSECRNVTLSSAVTKPRRAWRENRWLLPLGSSVEDKNSSRVCTELLMKLSEPWNSPEVARLGVMGWKRTNENHFQTVVPLLLEGSWRTQRLSLSVLSHWKPTGESASSHGGPITARGGGGECWSSVFIISYFYSVASWRVTSLCGWPQTCSSLMHLMR